MSLVSRFPLHALFTLVVTLMVGAATAQVSDTDETTVTTTFEFANDISAPEDVELNLLATNPEGEVRKAGITSFHNATSSTTVFLEVTSVSTSDASAVTPSDYFYDDGSSNDGVVLFAAADSNDSGDALWNANTFHRVALIGNPSNAVNVNPTWLGSTGPPGTDVETRWIGLKKLGKGPGKQLNVQVVLTYTIGEF